MSRFLAAATPEAFGPLRELFELNLERNGLRVIEGVGMFDRVADRYMVFNVDGTVGAARQRGVEADRSSYALVQWWSDRACVPGSQRAEAEGSEPNAADDCGDTDE